MNTPAVATAATAAVYGSGRRDRVARFSRCRCKESTKEVVDAVVAGRGEGIAVPGTLRAREILYCPRKKQIGWRPLWCACSPCLKKEWESCVAASFVPAPVWVAEWCDSTNDWRPLVEAEGTNDVASEELEAEMDVGVGSNLEKGVVVAVEARHAEWGNHAYFLAKAVGKAFTLKRAKTDAYKNKFKKGDEVFEGTRRHPIATPIHSTEVVE
jgi:hypothetical protein